MASKCQIVKICGVKRRVCRKANGQIKSSTVVGKVSKRRAKRKASKRPKARKTKRSISRKTAKKLRSKATRKSPNVFCVKTRLNGKCREVCYTKIDGAYRIATNKPAKKCAA